MNCSHQSLFSPPSLPLTSNVRWNGVVHSFVLEFLPRLPWEKLYLFGCSFFWIAPNAQRNKTKCKRIQCPWLAFSEYSITCSLSRSFSVNVYSKYALLVAPERIQHTNSTKKKSHSNTFSFFFFRSARTKPSFQCCCSRVVMDCDVILLSTVWTKHIRIFILFTDEISAI